MFFSSPAYGQTFMPPAATSIAYHVDLLYGFLVVVSFISCVLVIGGFVYLGYYYRRKSENANGAWITHNNVLEFLWSFIPFVIFMIVFVWGWIVYHQLRSSPKNALEIAVTGQQWSWAFTYKSGKVSANSFYVPVDQDVRLVMSSKDVIHSFFIPAFRTKQDVVPGMYTSLSFKANQVGEYHVFCTEFCGDAHSSMLAKLHVVPREKYEEWLASEEYKGLAPAAVGQKVYTKVCMVCHDATAARKVGPGWAGIFGATRELEGGKTAIADENYIRQSIMDPNAAIAKGFPPAMPSFAGQLSDEEVMGLIEFMKTLK